MELRHGDGFLVDAAIREAAETAIGIEENLRGTPIGEGLGRAIDDGLGGLSLVGGLLPMYRWHGQYAFDSGKASGTLRPTKTSCF